MMKRGRVQSEAEGQKRVHRACIHVSLSHSPNEHAIAVPTIPPPDIIMSKSSFSDVLDFSSHAEHAKPLRAARAPWSALTETHRRPIPNTPSLVNILAEKQT